MTIEEQEKLDQETKRVEQWKARATTLEQQRDEYFRRLQKIDPKAEPLE